MAFPQVRATNTSTETSNTTTHTVSLPASIAAGDLLIITLALDSFGAVNAWTFPGLWVEILDVEHSTTQVVSVGVAYLLSAVGGETSVDVTSSVSDHSGHTAYRIDSWHGTTAPEVASTDGNDENPDPPALNPTNWGAEDTLWIAGFGADRPTTWHPTTGDPTNYTDGIEGIDDASSGVGIRTVRRENNTASENPGTYSLTAGEQWISFTIGVRPAAAAAAAIPELVMAPYISA